MRTIGNIAGERDAAVLGDYLFVRGIDNQIDREADGTFSVWIHSDDQIAAAQEILAQYRLNPSAPEFQKVAEEARKEFGRRLAESERQAARTFNRSQIWPSWSIGPVTIIIMAVCGVVFLFSKMGYDRDALMGLFITKIRVDGDYMYWMKGLPEIRSGEVWRLVTPIFIHFGPIHLMFNMLWMKDLGTIVERKVSPGFLGWFIVVVAAVSNYAEFRWGGIASFGGMSGIIYALFGYIWIRGKYDPESGFYIAPSTVWMMMIWFVVCVSGALPVGVANIVHGVGLGMGMVWGYLAAMNWFGLIKRP
ncbi:MAG TPA: rhomboid family intramembrane serine protease [Roseimicrobium sp.]|nr:rhomboid family intramembrane serine protease [Roseimicrobium sp.]